MTRAALLAVVVVALAGCGSDAPARTSSTTAPAPAPRTAPPPAVEAVESAAEDTIDHAVAGQRAAAIRTARRLQAEADGRAATALRSAGVSAARVGEFRARAHEVATLAASAPLLRVALAANHAFEMVPGFFARYRTPVPATVNRFDYLDYEAKLRAKTREAQHGLDLVDGVEHVYTR